MDFLTTDENTLVEKLKTNSSDAVGKELGLEGIQIVNKLKKIAVKMYFNGKSKDEISEIIPFIRHYSRIMTAVNRHKDCVSIIVPLRTQVKELMERFQADHKKIIELQKENMELKNKLSKVDKDNAK